MEYLDIVTQRYATKRFDGRKIDDEKVSQLLEIIRQSPSGLNLQPWKIKVITDQALKEKLQPHTHNQPQVTTCSHLLVLCADTDIETLASKLESQMRSAGAPGEYTAHLVGMGRAMAATMTPEQRLSLVQNQVYMALCNAVNGAKALGFDSCPIGGFEPGAYSRILGLPSNLVPTAVCPIGYAADVPLVKLRFPLAEILI